MHERAFIGIPRAAQHGAQSRLSERLHGKSRHAEAGDGFRMLGHQHGAADAAPRQFIGEVEDVDAARVLEPMVVDEQDVHRNSNNRQYRPEMRQPNRPGGELDYPGRSGGSTYGRSPCSSRRKSKA
jgi:hypothetical protein